jgi:hypothetical protein
VSDKIAGSTSVPALWLALVTGMGACLQSRRLLAVLEDKGETFLETFRLPHLSWEEAQAFKQEHEAEQLALDQQKKGIRLFHFRSYTIPDITFVPLTCFWGANSRLFTPLPMSLFSPTHILHKCTHAHLKLAIHGNACVTFGAWVLD